MSRLLLPLLLIARLVDAQLADHPKLRPPEQPNPKTLLSPSVIDSLVDELSGSIGIAHILELNPYERNRPAEEYKGLYRESAYMEKKLKEYKLDQVDIKRDPMRVKQWDGEDGEEGEMVAGYAAGRSGRELGLARQSFANGGGRWLGPGEADKHTGMGIGEAGAFANGKRSILDIRDAVSAEVEQVRRF